MVIITAESETFRILGHQYVSDATHTGLWQAAGKTDADLVEIVKTIFDLRPGCIIRDLNLRRPIMRKTAAYGHFGRDDPDFTWEQVKELKL